MNNEVMLVVDYVAVEIHLEKSKILHVSVGGASSTAGPVEAGNFDGVDFWSRVYVDLTRNQRPRLIYVSTRCVK